MLAKKPGITSFSSLNIIKKSLGTKKVGHTGTLDSFAQGLLVVCTGSLTRLAGQITAFDKTYEAVIEFGAQTDTLDPTGVVIKNAPLPTLQALKESLKKFTGKIMQRPPEFSAIKIDGKRASDLQRAGKIAEIPAREITVYSSCLNEVQLENDRVKYARVTFSVSKGTYIRSLARDIGEDCKSAAHLVGLLRTSVGMFNLCDAAFADSLAPFTIADVTGGVQPTGVAKPQGEAAPSTSNGLANSKGVESPQGVQAAASTDKINSMPKSVEALKSIEADDEIVSKMQSMSPSLARACGLEPLTLCAKYENDFYNGRPLRQKMFQQGGTSMPNGFAGDKGIEAKFAVFQESGVFCGVISAQGGRFKYEFVVHKE